MINLTKQGQNNSRSFSERLIACIRTPHRDRNELGATIALGLIYMKSHDMSIASDLLPQSKSALDLIRADYLMIRVITRNLIFWNEITPTVEWLNSLVPDFIARLLKCDDSSINPSALEQSKSNIIAGGCFSIGLKYAG